MKDAPHRKITPLPTWSSQLRASSQSGRTHKRLVRVVLMGSECKETFRATYSGKRRTMGRTWRG